MIVVALSIVGIDRVPYGYYQGKRRPRPWHDREIRPSAPHRGPRAAGQGVDSDSGSGQFDGKTAGELDDSSLARRVAAPGRGSDEAKRTGQGEDTTVPSGAHGPGGRTAGQPGSYDVDLQARAQRPDVELIKGAACLHARAGHEHVESTVVRRDPLDKVRDGALVGDITRAALHSAPGPGGQAGNGALAAFSRPAGEHDIGARIGQSRCDRQAETGRAARDQRNLPGPRQSGRRCCGDVELTFPTSLVDHLGMIAEVHLCS